MTVDEAENVRRAACHRKRTYSSPGPAHSAARALTGKYGEPMQHYSCSFCDGWHVGSSPIDMSQLGRIAKAVRVLAQGVEI